ncbi:hypothetical protein [Thermomonospora cellulosilytica]|uniref:Uncharacterized protein n=1 Tax=Thermomonospora cellulosilytica TaxID=1411118 RepID=A0A7W3R6T3_9ACTN|nr:hypothetical protein [Thermomonospora cellulosilytica]MBA9002533.1 hypothetical protein [Thermomonospora cellulosilytica]
MSCDGWAPGPFGLDAAKGSTIAAERTVLVVVHHLTAATRLADVVPLVGRDRRIQTVFTASAASVLSAGIGEHLRACGGVVIPFRQATQIRFDLAVAAGDGDLARVHAPVLHLQHGMGPGVRSHRWAGAGPAAPRPMPGLRRETLLGGGRIIPAVIGLPHRGDLNRLAEICPEALPAARVVGDPAFDRLTASLPLRERYRRALGVTGGRRLVVVSSTWGPRGLVGRYPGLLSRLAAELPADRYAVVAALHPVIWAWHGPQQILAWFDDCRRRGVGLLPPQEGWRAALAAADLVVGDHGSVTHYAAGVGIPVMLGAFPDDDVVPGTAADRLRLTAPRLMPDRPLREQIDAFLAAGTAGADAVLRDRLTSEPGRSAVLLRRVMYELLRLPEPVEPPSVDPAPLPVPIDQEGVR